jgi:YVTN family beta-propeller protein
VEAWVKPSALGACTALACTSIVHRELNASSRTWWLGIDGSSIRFLLFLTQPSGGRVDVFSPGEVVPGVFQHIAASYDGIAVRLYHNGTLVWTQVVGPANFNNGDPVNIGIEDLTSSGSYLPFNGSIDELSIYNRALSGLEIAAIVGAGTAGKCRPLTVRAVYVTNAGSATVSVIDPATNAVVATVPVGRNPVDVAVTPNGVSAYVTNAGASSVSVINTATNTVIATVPVGHNPANVAITPDGGAAYVANAGSSSVSVINTATNTVVATVPVGFNPAKVAITPNGSTAYVANAGSSSVSVINTATHAVTATVPVGLNPVGIAIH